MKTNTLNATKVATGVQQNAAGVWFVQYPNRRQKYADEAAARQAFADHQAAESIKSAARQGVQAIGRALTKGNNNTMYRAAFSMLGAVVADEKKTAKPKTRTELVEHCRRLPDSTLEGIIDVIRDVWAGAIGILNQPDVPMGSGLSSHSFAIGVLERIAGQSKSERMVEISTLVTQALAD